jgi:hypothetical protein
MPLRNVTSEDLFGNVPDTRNQNVQMFRVRKLQQEHG